MEHVLAFAAKADAHDVVLFHHDPYHTDDELDALLADARSRRPGDRGRIHMAHEGMTIRFDERAVAFVA